EVVIQQSRPIPLTDEQNGYFSGFIDNVCPGSLYQFRIDHNGLLLPDPASRFQPEGPHGPSEVVTSSSYRWRDVAWPGVHIEGQVIYEMHIGTFTPEGTWNAARQLLPELADTGITLLEVMPAAEFSGDFGWGYDGVDLFAPTHLYGRPDDFRAFVDDAQTLVIGVMLDFVYNRVGADAKYLKHFAAP